MVKVNMQDEGESFGGSREPGIYLATIASAEEATSRNGHAMFKLKLEVGGQTLCYANLMLEGKGWSIGRGGLLALGVPESWQGEIHAWQLQGRKAYVAVKWQNEEKKYLEVDIGVGSAGWWRPDDPPHEFDPDPDYEEINMEADPLPF